MRALTAMRALALAVLLAACVAGDSPPAMAADDYSILSPGNIKLRSNQIGTSTTHSPTVNLIGGNDATEANRADVTAAGALKTDSSHVTQPVSGSIGIIGNGNIATVRDLTNSKPVDVSIVNGSGDQLTSFGGTAADDNSAFTGGTTDITPAGFLFDATPPAVADGNIGAARMNANRDLRVAPVDSQGDDATDTANNAVRVNVVSGPAGGTSTTDDAAFTLGTTATTPMGCIEATDSMDAGDVGGVKCGADRELDVDVVSITNATASNFNAEVQGDAAHDAAVSGNPVLQGLEARTSNGTAVSNGDAVRAQADSLGRTVVAPYGRHDQLIDGCATATSTTSNIEVIAAQGAGSRIYITEYSVVNESATSVRVDLKTATTLKKYIPAPANFGGSVQGLPTPLRFGDNEAVNFATHASVNNVKLCASGYVATN